MTSIIVNIDVPDLVRGMDFYTSAFGLTPGRRIGDGAQELLGGPAPIWLLANADGSVAAPGAHRGYARHWTPVHLDLVVDDVDAAVARAAAAGAVIEKEVRDYPWGRIAVLADPFGNGFCIIQFSGGGYDVIAGTQTG